MAEDSGFPRGLRAPRCPRTDTRTRSPFYGFLCSMVGPGRFPSCHLTIWLFWKVTVSHVRGATGGMEVALTAFPLVFLDTDPFRTLCSPLVENRSLAGSSEWGLCGRTSSGTGRGLSTLRGELLPGTHVQAPPCHPNPWESVFLA